MVAGGFQAVHPSIPRHLQELLHLLELLEVVTVVGAVKAKLLKVSNPLLEHHGGVANSKVPRAEVFVGQFSVGSHLM